MSMLFATLELSRMAGRLAATNVTAEDHVALVTSSDQHHGVVEALAVALEQAAASLTVVSLSPPIAGKPYRHPAPAISAARSADVVIVATTLAFPRAYDDLSVAVLDAGGRLVLLNNAAPEDLARGAATADPFALDRATDEIARAISHGSLVRIDSPEGTHLELGVSRPCYALTGTADAESGFGSFPSGEAMLAVAEGTAQGTFVATDFGQAVYLDGHGPPLGVLEDHIILEIQSGRVVEIDGGSAARRLRSILESGDANAWHIGELGIGTNPQARDIDAVENKFRAGTAHIALGSNEVIGWRAASVYGGTIASSLHIDLVARDIALSVDGQRVAVTAPS